MPTPLAELERLRRLLQHLDQAAGSIENAIDKGWINQSELSQKTKDMHRDQAIAEKLRTSLDALVQSHHFSPDGTLENWINLHLLTCSQLLKSCAADPSDDSRIRSVCLGELLTQLGEVLQRRLYNRTNFQINPSLTTYNQTYDSLAAQHPK
jgi:hypothetical protein